MLAEAMGIKAGVEPLALWEAVRTGASARSTASTTGFCRTSTTLPALRRGQKDKRLATELGRELGVPMRLANGIRRDDGVLNRAGAGRTETADHQCCSSSNGVASRSKLILDAFKRNRDPPHDGGSKRG